MKVGDRVRKSPMWKYSEASGEIKKVTADGYVVVKWDGVPGEWHYTEEQSKRIEVCNEEG